MLWRAPWLRHRVALMTLAAWDAASVYMSYNMTYVLRLGTWEGWSLGLAVVSATWLGSSYVIGRYSPTAEGDRDSRASQAGKTVLAGCAVIAIFIGHSWLYQVVDAQTRFRGFLIPLVVCVCLLSTLGQAMRAGVGHKSTNWILLGSEEEANTISKELALESNLLKLRTSISNHATVLEEIDRASNYPRGVAVGTIGEGSDKINNKLLRLRERGERVIPLLSWCEQELQRIPPELVHHEWLIQAEGFGLRPGSISWRVKRFGDVAGAIALIVFTAPLAIVCGACVWLEDRGPVFYRQIRSGLYGRPISIWKLRSMKVNAEESGARWASKADARVTRIGRLIRATRIDELPQLFSVLNGDLSLIGPRPERPEIEEQLEKQIENYRIRHWIRPGLSGWAQVCYPYGASTADSRMKLSYDLYYLRNASILLDILITMKTIRLVLNAKGASPKAH